MDVPIQLQTSLKILNTAFLQHIYVECFCSCNRMLWHYWYDHTRRTHSLHVMCFFSPYSTWSQCYSFPFCDEVLNNLFNPYMHPSPNTGQYTLLLEKEFSNLLCCIFFGHRLYENVTFVISQFFSISLWTITDNTKKIQICLQGIEAKKNYMGLFVI